MNSAVILNAAYASLEKLVQQFLESLEGIPGEDLNTWKPAAENQGGGPMNTFAGLSVHVIGAARWRIEQQLYDDEYARDRDSEFTATASRAEITEHFSTMLTNFRERIDSGRQVDLASLPTTIREDHPDRTRLDWLMSAIEHTALHLGHVQIHRQLWLAERAHTP